MALTRWIACFIIAASLLPTAAFGQSPELQDLVANAKELIKQKQYDDAVPMVRDAAAQAEEQLGFEHPYVAKSLELLGDVYKAQRKYVDAESVYQQALAIREAAFGANDRLVALSLKKLADTYRAQKRYAEAEPLYKRALTIREKEYGQDHRLVSTILRKWPMCTAPNSDIRSPSRSICARLKFKKTSTAPITKNRPQLCINWRSSMPPSAGMLTPNRSMSEHWSS